MEKSRLASVLIDVTLTRENKTFDYLVGDLTVSVGARVLVPFGKQSLDGFVLELKNETDCPPEKLKPITKVMDDFVALKPEALALADKICNQFKLRKIDVLRLFVPPSLRGRKRPRVAKNATLRARTIENTTVTLNPQQQDAVNAICQNLPPFAKGVSAHADGGFSNVFVLHGVTGSGKTEVYMTVIERMIAQNRTAIMLVPEIGLTPQMLGNFRNRFGDTVAMMHSGMTPGERFDEWFRLFTGEAKIAIGARSAIFAPLENLGVIIIDEEHDTSYFAESNPRFSTHEIAAMRCEYWHAPLVLGSATPSVATYQKTQPNPPSHTPKTPDFPPQTPEIPPQYTLLKLTNRVANIPMPTIEIVDMGAELRAGNGGIFSRLFLEKLESTIKQGKQAIIFLNRRGYSQSVMCRNCGWVAKCDHCDVALVYHKEDRQLKCHYCASRFSPVTKCKNCGSEYLKFGATGTQKVVEELEKVLNGGKMLGESTSNMANTEHSGPIAIFRLDADNTKTRGDLLEILEKFGATKPSVLVGTQMIAKGHHFADVALVGIIDADNSLHFSDFRATERTFALITQVAGRCGRAGDVGEVVLQTYIPSHYAYRLAATYDYDKFVDKELNTRLVTKYPPFTTIVRVLVVGEREDLIKEMLFGIMGKLRARAKDFVYLGAMKSPLGRLDDKFRYQILCRFDESRSREMIDFIDAAVIEHQSKSVTAFLEINPQSLS